MCTSYVPWFIYLKIAAEYAPDPESHGHGKSALFKKDHGRREGQSLEKCTKGRAGQEAVTLPKHGKVKLVHKNKEGENPEAAIWEPRAT